jgi:hypothetical protein
MSGKHDDTKKSEKKCLVLHVSVKRTSGTVLISVAESKKTFGQKNKKKKDGCERFKAQGHTERRIASTEHLENA